MPPSLSRVRAELARRSFSEFVRQAWPLVEPRPLVWSWYLDLLCAELEALVRGDTNRHLVNLPPRLAKSLLASVFLPAWAWANDPTLRFMHISYGEELAVRDSVRCRRVIESEWYRGHFGPGVALVGDHNLKHRFENAAGGVRLAAGLGGPLTGEGADVIVFDDPQKAVDAHS